MNHDSNISREEWNRFVLQHSGSFLQSWEWGEFQEKFGRRVFRLADFEQNWTAQCVEMKMPIINRRYWYAPKGPIFANCKSPIANREFNEFIDKISEVAQKEGVMFFRIGPEWEIANREALIAYKNQLETLGFRQLHYDIEPSQTLILNLTRSEDELLAQMHEKWRYNIRLAQKKGVQIKIIKNTDADFEKYFKEFYKLVNQGTSVRKEIKHHKKEYYCGQLEIPDGDLKISLFIAEYENQVIAANIVAIFGKRATYLHGATSDEHREVMAPHLMQWEQIRYVKNQGCNEYDFWGIVNEHTLDKRGKSWEGFTRFKKGFGGREINYVGYWDWALDKRWYYLYRIIQKIRR